jgi:hypothetical protein
MAKSFGQLTSLFQVLAQNPTTANNTLAGILINDQARYTLLKWFDNERTFYMTTVGPAKYTVTAISSIGAISATLSSAWTNVSCQQQVVFDSGEQRTVNFVQNSTTISWQPALTIATTTTTISGNGVQFYPYPANVSKLTNETITIGQLVYTTLNVNSNAEWTRLNALPYNAAYPAYAYIYNRQLGFWPIPSTTGYVITLYGQAKVSDMTYADYTTGTVAATIGSNAIVGTSTLWTSIFPTGVDLTSANLFLTITPPSGDGLPYQITSFTDATHLTLAKPIQNAPGASASYVIGQYPLLDDNFHDAIVYGALRTYFESIGQNGEKAQYYGGLFNEKMSLAEGYLSTKQNNVDLGITTSTAPNPNLYPMSIG